jgi:hypothetical protein
MYLFAMVVVDSAGNIIAGTAFVGLVDPERFP